MKRALPIIVLLILGGVLVYHYYPRWFTKPQDKNKLLVSGNIEAHEAVLSFKVQGRITELSVEEGQWVEEGAVLARLDDTDFRQQVTIDEANLRATQAQLTLALAGARQQEIEQAAQSIREAEADLQQRKLDLERAEALLRKDAGSQQARDLAETNLKRSEANLRLLRERHNQLVEGTRKEQIGIVRADVARAREGLQLSRIKLGHTLLRAPKAGVVLVRQAELGEVVAPGTPVVTLADLDNVWLRGYISETDLGRVRWGQDAALRTDTFPEKTYKGRVSFISSKAEFTPKSVETHKERVTLVYRVKIDVENPNYELKPGMPADASLELLPR